MFTRKTHSKKIQQAGYLPLKRSGYIIDAEVNETSQYYLLLKFNPQAKALAYKNTLISVKFYDAMGNLISKGYPKFAFSKNVGYLKYLSLFQQASNFSIIDFTTPKNAHSIQLKIIKWIRSLSVKVEIAPQVQLLSEKGSNLVFDVKQNHAITNTFHKVNHYVIGETLLSTDPLAIELPIKSNQHYILIANYFPDKCPTQNDEIIINVTFFDANNHKIHDPHCETPTTLPAPNYKSDLSAISLSTPQGTTRIILNLGKNPESANPIVLQPYIKLISLSEIIAYTPVKHYSRFQFYKQLAAAFQSIRTKAIPIKSLKFPITEEGYHALIIETQLPEKLANVTNFIVSANFINELDVNSKTQEFLFTNSHRLVTKILMPSNCYAMVLTAKQDNLSFIKRIFLLSPSGVIVTFDYNNHRKIQHFLTNQIDYQIGSRLLTMSENNVVMDIMSGKTYLVILGFAPKARPKTLADVVISFAYYDSVGKALENIPLSEIPVINSLSSNTIEFVLMPPKGVHRVSLNYRKANSTDNNRILLAEAVRLVELSAN